MITKEQTVFLLRIGVGIVFIQNGLLLSLLAIGLLFWALPPQISDLVLCIDIIGFLIIALALLLFSQYEIPKKRIYYRLSGSFIVGWVIVTMSWRLLLIIESQEFSNILLMVPSYISTMPMFLFLALSGILLAVGIICLYYVRRDRFTLMFSIFGILNLISSFVMAIMFHVTSDLDMLSFDALEIYCFIIGIYLIKGFLVPVVAFLLFQPFFFQERIYGGWIGRDWEEKSKEKAQHLNL